MTPNIAICGRVGSGKTTYANTFEVTHEIIHTDDILLDMRWSQQSDWIADFILAAARPGPRPRPFVIEGMPVVRGLRKLALSGRLPESAKLQVVWLDTIHRPNTPHQDAMSRGARTIYEEVFPA